MKERSILFSGPMVQAILQGRKTQTRRIVKERPPYIYVDEGRLLRDDGLGEYNDYFPYGVPGDRLWVKETWATDAPSVDDCRRSHEDVMGGQYHPYYKATSDEFDINSLHWRSPIFMPRWASRITLEITNIRVERLQEITEEDAKAEGSKPYDNPLAIEYMHTIPDWRPYSHGYKDIWESINGPGSWDANPWVWVIEFKRIHS